MTADLELTAVADIIQTAIAPVFLLAGISALLGVMTNRLTRVIDRWRTLQRALKKVSDQQNRLVLEKEMKKQFKRGRIINLAITFATTSALLVCLVIVSLFLSSLIGKDAAVTISVLFIACIGILILALCSFLAEVLIATRSLRRGLYTIESLTHADAED